MNIRAASLLFAFTFAALPAQAQSPGGGRPAGAGENIQSLARDLAALTARVAKLEGQITASDLAGTYAFTAFGTEMSLPLITTSGPWYGLLGGAIGSGVEVGTVTLAADGTGSFNVTNPKNILSSNTITQGVPTWQLLPDSHNEAGNLTWTYANGTLAVSGGPSFSVAAGGRVLIFADSSSNPNPSTGQNQLVILTRLQ